MPIVVTLRLPDLKASDNDFLDHVEISLSAAAREDVTTTGPDDGRASQYGTKAKVVLATKTFTASASMRPLNTGRQQDHVYYWIDTLHLSHPRQASSDYRLHFAATATYKAPVINTDDATSDLLPSGTALPANMLSQLTISAPSAAKELNLPSTRIKKMVSQPQTVAKNVTSWHGTSHYLPFKPSLDVRYMRHILDNATLLTASVRLWQSASYDGIDIQRVSCHGEGVGCRAIHAEQDLLPRRVTSGDETNFIWDVGSSAYLTIEIQASVMGSGCGAILFHKAEIEQNALPTRRSNSPPQTQYWQHDDSPKGDPSPYNTSESGMRINVTVPQDITQGERFTVTVFVDNATSRTRTMSLRTDHSRQGSQSRVPNQRHMPDNTTASAVIGHLAIKEMSHEPQSAVLATELNADTIIGPLEPGKCHDARLGFVCFRTGVVNFKALSLVDLDKGESLLVTDLPRTVSKSAIG